MRNNINLPVSSPYSVTDVSRVDQIDLSPRKAERADLDERTSAVGRQGYGSGRFGRSAAYSFFETFPSTPSAWVSSSVMSRIWMGASSAVMPTCRPW